MTVSDNKSADSYYEASRRYHIDAAPLSGDGAQRADVVVIGGGITGSATALCLAERGVDVALLESRHFGWGASGRSGGQIIAGYAIDQHELENLTGQTRARELWEHSLAALAWTRRRIGQHQIRCDLTDGYLHVAVRPGQARELHQWAEHLTRRYNYASLDYLERAPLQRILASELYSGGVADSASGHLHPLNYCLGLTRAAQQAGARLYCDSAVTAVQTRAAGQGAKAGPAVRVHTAHGVISCDAVVYACNAYLDRLQPRLSKWIMPVGTCIVATEPLPASTARGLIANRAAVSDTNFVLDYYRLSADNRMLFGGRVSYSTLEPRRMIGALRRRMLRVFPQLAGVGVEFSWGGHVAITLNRAPHIGQLERDANAWFAQGFSGQGMALSGYVGALLADAVLGETEPLDCFRAIPHKPFPGGRALRMPALVAAMAWRRLRDGWPPRSRSDKR